MNFLLQAHAREALLADAAEAQAEAAALKEAEKRTVESQAAKARSAELIKVSRVNT